MKKVIEVSIGGINFTMEDDAYYRLKEYLRRFEETISDKKEAREVMEDVEARVAEIFQKEMKFSNQVVDMRLVQVVIDHLGEVETKTQNENQSSSQSNYDPGEEYTRGNKKFYRDMDDKMLAGVCSGIATYTGVDVTIIRLIFVALAFAYGSAILAYFILWIVSPRAETIAQKLELRGYAPTADNIRKFTSQRK
ncbi:MAG: PspC domain-containing protein [Dysgonomonas sp.]|jgi:phage shock protein PspC (stress-responsive transcriptional regulator)|uniref:PspC domain-containing protein n=1 Tax=unclassified Dysgonomonas TaxID=2630389 RepID=UPI0025BE495F|nr:MULTISPECIES: PspC domain-containing protein [unclassified Dysgonomonas]MDR2003335.1 PspC domain-containing protein [Prevotella sp.]HMM04552.1 PspC domain-containing protein [Dysgonomonas sp.]